MVPVLLTAVLILADAAPAAAPSAAPPAAAAPSTVSPITVQGAKDPTVMVCHNEAPLGTRVPHRVCHQEGGGMETASARQDLRANIKMLNKEFDYKPDIK